MSGIPSEGVTVRYKQEVFTSALRKEIKAAVKNVLVNFTSKQTSSLSLSEIRCRVSDKLRGAPIEGKNILICDHLITQRLAKIRKQSISPKKVIVPIFEKKTLHL